MRSLMKMQRWGFPVSFMVCISFVSVGVGCSPPLYPNRGGGEEYKVIRLTCIWSAMWKSIDCLP